MVQGPKPSPKKRRARKGKGHSTPAVPCESTGNMACAALIPDLNELPGDVEVSDPPPVVPKKRSSCKKKAPVNSEEPSVTAQGTATIKPRRRVSKAKVVAVVTEDPTLSSEVDANGAPLSDPGCITDVAPPKKRAPRKKKGFLELLQGSGIHY